MSDMGPLTLLSLAVIKISIESIWMLINGPCPELVQASDHLAFGVHNQAQVKPIHLDIHSFVNILSHLCLEEYL